MRNKSSIPIYLSVALAAAYIFFSVTSPEPTSEQPTQTASAMKVSAKPQPEAAQDFAGVVKTAVTQAREITPPAENTPEPREQQPPAAKPADYSTNLPLALQGEPIGKREYFEDGNFQVVLNREDVGRLAPNLGMLVANAVPSLAYRDGVLVGVEIGSAGEGSVLSHFGFESGDILNSINGLKVNDPFEAVLILKNLDSNQVKIRVNRGEEPKELSFQMVE